MKAFYNSITLHFACFGKWFSFSNYKCYHQSCIWISPQS